MSAAAFRRTPHNIDPPAQAALKIVIGPAKLEITAGTDIAVGRPRKAALRGGSPAGPSCSLIRSIIAAQYRGASQDFDARGG